MLVLRDIDQMGYDRIADVLAIPIGTVKSRLFRARLALRHEMEQLDKALSPPKNVFSSNPSARHETLNRPESDRTLAPKEFNDG